MEEKDVYESDIDNIKTSEDEAPLTKKKVGRPKKEPVEKPNRRKVRSEAQKKAFEKAQLKRKEKE